MAYGYLYTPQQQPCPDKLNFIVAFHDGSIEYCDSVPVCVELEPVGKVVDPDACRIIVRNAPLCFDPDTGLWFANIRVEICNNFCEPRSYDFSVVPTSGPITAIPPGGGVIGPINPGDCRFVSFRVQGDFQLGEQWQYQITFQPTDGGPPVICRGQVTRPENSVKFIVVDDDPLGLDPAAQDSIRINYVVENSGNTAVTVPLVISREFGVFLIGTEEQAPERLSAETQIEVQPGQKAHMAIILKLADKERQDLPRFVEGFFSNLEDPAGFINARAIEIYLPDRFRSVEDVVVCLNCSKLQPTTPSGPG